MNQVDSTQTQADLQRLRQALQIRDQLVQQLSAELFRLITSSVAQQSDPPPQALQSLQKQFQMVKQQLAFHRQALSDRNAEIAHLQKSVQELSERNQTLERAVQELPNVYRQRFAERILPVKQKLEMLQKENCQLHARLHTVSYCLAAKTRPPDRVQLPNFANPAGSDPRPFGSAEEPTAAHEPAQRPLEDA